MFPMIPREAHRPLHCVCINTSKAQDKSREEQVQDSREKSHDTNKLLLI